MVAIELGTEQQVLCDMLVPRTSPANVTTRYSDGAVHLCKWREPGVGVHVDVGVDVVILRPFLFHPRSR